MLNNTGAEIVLNSTAAENNNNKKPHLSPSDSFR